MADNVKVTNQKTSFDTGTNPDPDVRTTEITGGKHIQHVRLDLGSGTNESVVSAAVPVSGTVTVNAGTNLNTSALALESGGNLDTIAGKDFATQTTLAALNTKVTACNTGAVVVSSSALPSGAATAVNQLANGHDVTVRGFTSIGHGSKNVATAGTAEALATSTSCKRIDITAKSTNTGTIWVGGTGVTAGNGRPLVALQMYSIDIANLASVFINSTVNGEGVTFTYFN